MIRKKKRAKNPVKHSPVESSSEDKAEKLSMGHVIGPVLIEGCAVTITSTASAEESEKAVLYARDALLYAFRTKITKQNESSE